MRPKAKWTFMVYMAGDNNLSSAGDEDLREMCKVGSTTDVNVLVEFDNAGDRGTNRYHVQRNDASEMVQSLGETDSGDPKVLLDFVEWAAHSFPAERYALVLWNHGCGWQPLEMDKIARTVRAADYNDREATERSASSLGRVFFRSTLERIFSMPSSNERAICSDDGTGHSLDTIELGNVLARTAEILGQPLDLLGMDACLMSNFEVAYQVRPYVKYLVASEENEPAEGWPYGDVLAALVAAPAMTTEELAAQIVNLYVRSYQESDCEVTQSALDLSKVEDLTTPLDLLAGHLTDHMQQVQTVIWKAQQRSVSFWHYTLWDITHFCSQLSEFTGQRVQDEEARVAVMSAADEVRRAMQSGSTKLVVAEAHQGAKVANCGGLTIYLPSTPHISRFYADLEFARCHRWPAMLKVYLET